MHKYLLSDLHNFIHLETYFHTKLLKILALPLGTQRHTPKSMFTHLLLITVEPTSVNEGQDLIEISTVQKKSERHSLHQRIYSRNRQVWEEKQMANSSLVAEAGVNCNLLSTSLIPYSLDHTASPRKWYDFMEMASTEHIWKSGHQT